MIAYYEKLLNFDWERGAREDIETLESIPLLVLPGVPTPEGMHRVSWGDLLV